MPDIHLQWLESAQAKWPEQASTFHEFGNLYQRKLWHQLTVKIDEALQQPGFRQGSLLIPLYENFISAFAHRLNLLRLAHTAVVVSQQYKQPAEAVTLLERVIKGLADSTQRVTDQPALFLRMHIAQNRLQMGEVEECKTLVEQGKEQLDKMHDVDPSVNAVVHFVRSQYFKHMKDFAEFYKSSLLYLAYISSEALPQEQKLALAVDISLAALLGKNIYNFGELLLHPIIGVLDENSNYRWLKLMLECFHAGNLHKYDELCSQYKTVLHAQPAMTQHVQALRQKITILCLMELIFSLPAHQRTIELEAIAARTKLAVDGVEFLLMKTLSLHLIEGVIDQVAGNVQVTWVQPRVLTMPQVSGVKDRLDGWISKVTASSTLLEDETADVVVA
eukprot:jgi/Astpho2/5712/Aster-02950